MRSDKETIELVTTWLYHQYTFNRDRLLEENESRNPDSSQISYLNGVCDTLLRMRGDFRGKDSNQLVDMINEYRGV